MKHILIASIFGFILFPSCQDQHTHSSGSDVVALNNGQRWEANTETSKGIANMQNILEYSKGKELDLLQLHTDLQDAYQTIFKQCTMTGEAHDRLHDYLIPIKGHLDNLLSASPEEEMTVVDNFAKYLSTYENYFTTSAE